METSELVYLTCVMFRKWTDEEYKSFPFKIQLQANMMQSISLEKGFPCDKSFMKDKQLIEKIRKKISVEAFSGDEDDY